jgi:hypothetical protein
MFCKACGNEFGENFKFKSSGHKIWDICDQCIKMPYQKRKHLFENRKNSFCVACGLKIKKSKKFCDVCRMKRHIANHKRKLAQYIIFENGYEILYECGCNGKKLKHHFDYDKPNQVIKLCKQCHGKWHFKFYAGENETRIPKKISRTG